MTSARVCRYQCGTLLDGWDDDAKKYKEAGTGELHTRDRCEAFKANSERRTGGQEEKNDHGNEQEGLAFAEGGNTDHTLATKVQLKLKTITDPTAEGMDLKYNKLAAEHNVKFSQYHPLGSLYTIAVYYEEVTA